MLTEGNIYYLKRFCSGDITTIEGYWEAFNDASKTRYCCHHREEIQEDGTIVSRQQLKKEGRYYGLTPDKLIIMGLSEHMRMHKKGYTYSEEFKIKVSESKKGIPQPKYRWLTPTREIREMSICNAKRWHPDWVLIK